MISKLSHIIEYSSPSGGQYSSPFRWIPGDLLCRIWRSEDTCLLKEDHKKYHFFLIELSLISHSHGGRLPCLKDTVMHPYKVVHVAGN